MEKQYKTFREFYPYYLAEHTNPVCRTLHFIGSWLVLGDCRVCHHKSGNAWWFAGGSAGRLWFCVGRSLLSSKKTAPPRSPIRYYSFAGDWVMFFQLLTGKIPFNARA